MGFQHVKQAATGPGPRPAARSRSRLEAQADAAADAVVSRTSELAGPGLGPRGRPLAPPVCEQCAAASGADFSDVRVRDDPAGTGVEGAVAFTRGTDIHFARGAYAPHTRQGRRLLAHELAHVVQQRTAGARLQRQR